jgi:hypothetical protein
VVEVHIETGQRLASLQTRRRPSARGTAWVREARLELVFSRVDVYEDKMREVYHLMGLLAYAAAAKEYVRML